MLRFTGEVDNAKAYIWGRVICKELDIDKRVRFCIDTGAQHTCLFEDDAIRIGVEVRKLRKRKNYACGVGGTADGCFLRNAEVRFLSDDGTTVIVPFPTLPILILRKDKLKRMVEFFRIRLLRKKRRRLVLPSLLGFDFLQECAISFSEKEAYLDIE